MIMMWNHKLTKSKSVAYSVLTHQIVKHAVFISPKSKPTYIRLIGRSLLLQGDR